MYVTVMENPNGRAGGKQNKPKKPINLNNNQNRKPINLNNNQKRKPINLNNIELNQIKNKNRTINENTGATTDGGGKPGTKFNPFEMFTTKKPTKSSKYEIKNKQNTIHFGAGMKLTMRYFPKYMQLVDKKKHMYAIYFQIIPYFNGVKMDHRQSRKFV